MASHENWPLWICTSEAALFVIKMKRRTPNEQRFTIEYLRSKIQYNPETGELKRTDGSGHPKASKRGGYQFTVDRLSLSVPRLVWALHYGAWPEADLHRQNGDTTDNRIANFSYPVKSADRPACLDAITVEDLHTWLSCDAEKGLLYAKRPSARRKVGQIRGSKNSLGYLLFQFRTKLCMVHRVVWAMHHGRWPEKCIDHINHIKDDNRIVNLREADVSDNGCNRGLPKNNTSGVKGVRWHRWRNRWLVRVARHGVVRHKYVRTWEEAVALAQKYREELHGEFACM